MIDARDLRADPCFGPVPALENTPEPVRLAFLEVLAEARLRWGIRPGRRSDGAPVWPTASEWPTYPCRMREAAAAALAGRNVPERDARCGGVVAMRALSRAIEAIESGGNPLQALASLQAIHRQLVELNRVADNDAASEMTTEVAEVMRGYNARKANSRSAGATAISYRKSRPIAIEAAREHWRRDPHARLKGHVVPAIRDKLHTLNLAVPKDDRTIANWLNEAGRKGELTIPQTARAKGRPRQK